METDFCRAEAKNPGPEDQVFKVIYGKLREV
jgi:hypothetical protein